MVSASSAPAQGKAGRIITGPDGEPQLARPLYMCMLTLIYETVTERFRSSHRKAKAQEWVRCLAFVIFKTE